MRDGGAWPHRRRTRLLAALSLAIPAAVVAIPAGLTASAAEPPQRQILAIEAGFASSYDSGVPIPVRVTVTADRLVRGTVSVDTPGGVVVSTRMEVAGGSRKRATLILPPIDSSGQLTVRARLDGTRPAEAQAEINSRDEAELVGLFPTVLRGRSLPPAAPLMLDAGSARFALLSDDDLQWAPASLEALGTIAAGPRDLAHLDARARDGLLQWVAGGGRLLVAVKPGDTVRSLPATAQPGRAGRIRIGVGEIVAAGADLGTRWDGVIEPTPLGGRRSISAASGPGGRGGPAYGLADELASDAGVRVPRIGWLTPLLIGWAVVATPLFVGVLRRTRRPLWAAVALPLSGVLLAGGMLIAGQDARTRITPSHATILDTTAFGTEATTFVGIGRSDPGRATVSFPRRWIADTLTFDDLATGAVSTSLGVNAAGASTTPETLLLAKGTQRRVEVGAGGFAILAGRGPAPDRGQLLVDARAETDDRVGGTVHNDTAWRLDQVAVFGFNSATNVGTLEPGEKREFSVFVPDVTSRADRPLGGDVWPVSSRINGIVTDNIVNFPSWLVWSARRFAQLAEPGSVTAVGWTSLPRPRVVTGAETPPFGRTAVVGRGLVRGDGASPPRSAVRRVILRGGRFGDTGIARFDLPRGTKGTFSARTVSGTKLEVWGATGWQPVGGSATDADSGFSSAITWTDVVLPASATAGGRLFVKVKGTIFASGSLTPVELLSVGLTPAPPPVTESAAAAPETTVAAAPETTVASAGDTTVPAGAGA